jgi:glutamate-1-semialdehyde aminotransferase
LLLVADETISAIRCGYRFAYKQFQVEREANEPDLVMFGKGLGNAGIAMNQYGGFVSKLSDEHRSHLIGERRYATTRMLGVLDCVRGSAIINMATQHDWVGKAKDVGREVDRLVRSVGGICTYTGAMCYIGRDAEFRKFEFGLRRPLPADSNQQMAWERWLPPIDVPVHAVKELFHAEYRTSIARMLTRGGLNRLDGWVIP